MRQFILVLCAVSFLTIPTHAFFRNLCIGEIAFGRIDPIVSQGRASPHLHHLNGGSNMDFEATGETLSVSNCTNSIITPDKSGYWAPNMFFQHENGTFEMVGLALGLTAYYKYEKRPLSGNADVVPFPKGLKMVAGNSTKRTWTGPWPVPDMSSWGPADITQAALGEKAIGFNCMNYLPGGHAEGSFEHPWIRAKDFLDASCPDGLRAEIIFPSCWNGKDLDSSDHQSHLQYPELIQDGVCPPTHPVNLPILFFETIYNTQDFAGLPGKFMMSNGDPTGFGYHADFIASWDDGIQEAIMADPTCTGPGLSGRVEDCHVFNGRLQSQEAAARCKMEMPEMIQHEQIRVAVGVNMLPGNMPITGVRHDPGVQVDQAVPVPVPSNSPPPALNTQPSKSIIVEATPAPSSITMLPSSASPTPFSVVTSVFTTSGQVVEMVIIEEIDTVTVTASPQSTQTVINNGTDPTPASVTSDDEASLSPMTTHHAMHRRHAHARRHGSHVHGHL